MSNIQHARDVLAKWRENPAGMPWRHMNEDDARLIVGTAGNPALLDAIDAILYAAVITAQLNQDETALHRNAERIATAIIAADERMSA